MSQSDPNQFARKLFTGLPAHYDLLAEALSFAQNRRWRAAMVDHVVPARPSLTLDVATGPAGVALQLARRTPGTVVGIDLTPAMLRRGQANVERSEHRGRIVLSEGRAEALPFPDDTFDALTFTYLLRYVADPAATMRELARVLKPGAPIASLDFFVPPNPVYRAIWWAYTRALLPAGGWAGGLLGGLGDARDWYEVGRFLGPNISTHYRRHPLTSIVGAWEAAGLEAVGSATMSFGAGLVMWGSNPPGVPTR